MEKIIKKRYLKKIKYQWGAGICDLLYVNGNFIPVDRLSWERPWNDSRAYSDTYYISRSGASGAGNFWYSPVAVKAEIACQIYQSWGTFVFSFRPAVLSEFAIKLKNGGFEIFKISRDGNKITIAGAYESPESSEEVFADGMSCHIARGKGVPRWAARALAYKIITPNPPKWESETVAGRFGVLKSPIGYIKFHASSAYAEKVWEAPMLFGFGVEAENEKLIVFLKDEEVLVLDKADTAYEWQSDLESLREKGSEKILAEAETAIAQKKAIDARSEKQKNFSAKECAEILNTNPSTIFTVEDSFAAGNCQYGTREFMKIFFECADSVSAKDILTHKHSATILNNPQFRRVVFDKFFPAVQPEVKFEKIPSRKARY